MISKTENSQWNRRVPFEKLIKSCIGRLNISGLGKVVPVICIERWQCFGSRS